MLGILDPGPGSELLRASGAGPVCSARDEGAVAEALSPPGVDNVTVPLLVAAAYRFLA